jgi:hypothetical protein
MSIEQRWIAAQVGERRFHCDYMHEWGPHADPNVRRVREAASRAWYAGMLEIPYAVPEGASVTDFCCGPQSLLTTYPTTGRMVAVDPLRFTDEDERTYATRGIERAVMPAERYAERPTTEAWCYNGLQHVMDWEAALRAVCHAARDTVRIFEWVGVPTDSLHLHTLEVQPMQAVLQSEGFLERSVVVGHRAHAYGEPSAFYAAVWGRVT